MFFADLARINAHGVYREPFSSVPLLGLISRVGFGVRQFALLVLFKNAKLKFQINTLSLFGSWEHLLMLFCF